MGPLGPLLMYMVFGLPDSAEQWIHCSPFRPIESGGKADPGGRKSAAVGFKLAAFDRESVGARRRVGCRRNWRRRGENRSHSVGNRADA
jgi:hypothetical protein